MTTTIARPRARCGLTGLHGSSLPDRMDGDDRRGRRPDSGPCADATAPLTIAVLTFRRPRRPRRGMLPLLVEQARGVARARRRGRVLVVDNDPAGRGASASRRRRRGGRPATARPLVEYVHEPRRASRRPATGRSTRAPRRDLLVFIDDDERPTDRLAARRCSRCRPRPAPRRSSGPVVVASTRSSRTAGSTPAGTSSAAGLPTARRSRSPRPTTCCSTSSVVRRARPALRHDARRDRRRGHAVHPPDRRRRRHDVLGGRGGRGRRRAAHRVTQEVGGAPRVLERQQLERDDADAAPPAGLPRLRARLGLTARGAVRAAGGVRRSSPASLAGSLATGRAARARSPGAPAWSAGAWGYSYEEYRRAEPSTGGSSRSALRPARRPRDGLGRREVGGVVQQPGLAPVAGIEPRAARSSPGSATASSVSASTSASGRPRTGRPSRRRPRRPGGR